MSAGTSTRSEIVPIDRFKLSPMQLHLNEFVRRRQPVPVKLPASSDKYKCFGHSDLFITAVANFSTHRRMFVDLFLKISPDYFTPIFTGNSINVHRAPVERASCLCCENFVTRDKANELIFLHKINYIIILIVSNRFI